MRHNSEVQRIDPNETLDVDVVGKKRKVDLHIVSGEQEIVETTEDQQVKEMLHLLGKGQRDDFALVSSIAEQYSMKHIVTAILEGDIDMDMAIRFEEMLGYVQGKNLLDEFLNELRRQNPHPRFSKFRSDTKDFSDLREAVFLQDAQRYPEEFRAFIVEFYATDPQKLGTMIVQGKLHPTVITSVREHFFQHHEYLEEALNDKFKKILVALIEGIEKKRKKYINKKYNVQTSHINEDFFRAHSADHITTAILNGSIGKKEFETMIRQLSEDDKKDVGQRSKLSIVLENIAYAMIQIEMLQGNEQQKEAEKIFLQQNNPTADYVPTKKQSIEDLHEEQLKSEVQDEVEWYMGLRTKTINELVLMIQRGEISRLDMTHAGVIAERGHDFETKKKIEEVLLRTNNGITAAI